MFLFGKCVVNISSFHCRKVNNGSVRFLGYFIAEILINTVIVGGLMRVHVNFNGKLGLFYVCVIVDIQYIHS